MMEPTDWRRKISGRHARVVLGVLAAALLGGLLYLVFRRGDDATSAAHGTAAGEPAKRSGYRNRGRFPVKQPERGESPSQKAPTISGFVYGMGGEVIAGATVVASSFETAGNMLSTAGTAQSDESGRFELALAPGTYQLNGMMAGYGTTSATAHTGDMTSLVLPKSGVIEGHVRDERGLPLRHFSIDVLSAVTADTPATPALWSRTFDSPDGAFRIDQLPSWEVVIRASAADYAAAFSPLTTVTSTETQQLDLTLTKGCVLSGKVTDASGLALPNVFVDVESLLVAGEMSDVSMSAANQAQTEDDGSFSMAHVPRGTVVVRGYDGSNAVSTVNVEISDCEKLEPVKLVMTPGGGLSGVARGKGGEPLAGAKLTLMHRPIGFVNTTSDEKGHFEFEQIPAGTVRLMMQYEGQVTIAGITIQEGKTTEQDVAMVTKGSGTIRGRVTAGGNPLPGVKLMVATNLGEDGTLGLYYPITESDGSYQVTGLQPGVYIVSVVSTSTGSGTRLQPDQVATVDLQVKPPQPMKQVAEEQATGAQPGR